MADNQQNRGSTLLNLSRFLCTIVWELTCFQIVLWAQVVSCHKPVTPSCSRTFVRSPLRKMSRQFPGFLANPTPPFKERELIPGGDKAGAKKKRSHMTRMQEITCEWTILVFEPSPFIPSAFVLLLPFMTPLIRCTSVLLPGPPPARLFVCRLVPAPCAPSFRTFPVLPFPSSDFFLSFCASWTFQVELDFQEFSFFFY